MDEKTYDNATHLLSCRHAIGVYGYDYTMRCHVLKYMPDGKRAKILVFGDRYWRGHETKKRIRYVNITRLTERVIDLCPQCKYPRRQDDVCPHCSFGYS